MSKSKNVSLMESYILLENEANRLMKTNRSGVSAYIAALEGQQRDPAADSTLIFLKKCRHVRNKLAHDPGALKSNTEITSDDVRRIKKLTEQMKLGKDPLSKLLKKSPSALSTVKLVLLCAAVIAFIVIAIILYNR